ncbi:retrotransposon protein, putative, ty3-gypsy subclass, partial [Tanacetum coccineum]
FDPEEDEENPEEDPADHPVDGADNDDNESSDDDDDDDDVVKDEEDKEEEEHLALADPSDVLIYDLSLPLPAREKKHYGGFKPLCSKCNYHHDGPCAPKCHKCNRVGHLARDCRSSINANTANNQRGTGASQKATCYECGNQGHYKNDCPERKNQNHENQTRGTGAHGVVYAFGGGETEQDLNNIKDIRP